MKLTENGVLRINFRYNALKEGSLFDFLHHVKFHFPWLVRLGKKVSMKDYLQMRPALRCNFSCSYCFTRSMKKHAFSEEHFLQAKSVFDKLSRIEDSLLVRINFDGETLVDDWAMKIAVHINGITNVKSCEFLTNNSIDPREYLHRLDPQKTYFNCSFHPENISLEKFFEHIDILRQEGIGVIANMVITPQLIRDVPDLCEAFEKKAIRFRPCLLIGYYQGKVYPHDYSEDDLEILKEHYYSPIEFEYMKGKSPKGKECFAGVDMLNIFLDGSVRRCSISQIGHVSDLVSGKKKLKQKPYPCPHDDCVSFCHIMGLKELRKKFILSDTFVDDYYPKEAGA